MSTDIGSNASAKLEGFVLMTKSAKGAAACKLIQDAISAPGVFVFAQLLDQPNIQELANGEYAPYYRLLELFTYGVFEDYLNEKETLPPLSAAQSTKLKHLTLVSLAMQTRFLPYSLLLQAMQLSSIRELEDLIIDAIHIDIVKGKLDQKEQRFEVESAVGRNIEPAKVEDLLVALQSWSKKIASVLTVLDNNLTSLATNKAAAAARQTKHEEIYEANLREAIDKYKTSRKTAPKLMSEDPMDIDDYPGGNENIRGKNRKTTIFGDTKQPRKRNRF